ncbi:hypothetical protein HMPREF0204_10948 [Chryseobacterium gleum ATCC 35910]|uniref:Uncharacterized protein n=1 Tax=Chryseobacterium gleum ATCC 35910 TaxID=525257 RepID=A0ABN0AVG6_CHRGE|nr:hypothetical protein HMPREF0204_10948 [Chryseobacterium gleum ATCC 35910]
MLLFLYIFSINKILYVSAEAGVFLFIIFNGLKPVSIENIII